MRTLQETETMDDEEWNPLLRVCSGAPWTIFVTPEETQDLPLEQSCRTSPNDVYHTDSLYASYDHLLRRSSGPGTYSRSGPHRACERVKMTRVHLATGLYSTGTEQPPLQSRNAEPCGTRCTCSSVTNSRLQSQLLGWPNLPYIISPGSENRRGAKTSGK